tara:strand:- start:2556 stop:4073 length:1518 start_codon:yes stop_codon:yes gene_type:complete
MASYTCYSKAHAGCGSTHRLLTQAAKCCLLHIEKYGEKREPVRLQTSDEMSKYPAGDVAAARRDAWLATRKDARQKYDPTQGGSKSPGGEPQAAQSEGKAEAPAQSEGKTEASAESVDLKIEGLLGEAASGQSETPPTPAPQDGAEHPLQPLANQLAPLMADGISKTVAPLLEKIAKDLKPGYLTEEMEAAANRAKAAAKKIEEGAKALDSELKRVDEAIAKIDETKKVEITVTSPELKQTKIEGAQHEHFELLLRLVGAGENVFMSGPAGSGKTTAATKVAEALGMDLIVQPVAMDKFEATGFIDAGGTFRESAVYKWAKAEKPSILLIDEIDAWMATALVSLNPILDNCLGIFPGGQQFNINPLHRVIATANTWGTGADAEYVGRNRLDAASLDRFGARLDWGYDEKFELRLMRSMFPGALVGAAAAKVSQRIRKNLKQHGIKIVWGPRQTIGLAKRIAAGLSVQSALDVSALAALAKTNRERVLAGVDLSGLDSAAASVATA